jgi:hypothetical protein
MLTFESVLPFGKHKGKTVNEVIEEEPGWVVWAARDNVLTFDNDVLMCAEREEMERNDECAQLDRGGY